LIKTIFKYQTRVYPHMGISNGRIWHPRIQHNQRALNSTLRAIKEISALLKHIQGWPWIYFVGSGLQSQC